jgi:hypothetical protein
LSAAALETAVAAEPVASSRTASAQLASLSVRIAPCVALAIGLGLRLWNIDLTRFYFDQVAMLQATNDFLDTGHIPLHSGVQFSVGVWVPPVATFLLAIPSLISRNVVWISAWMALVDSAGTLVVFALARRLSRSHVIAFAAALAYAAAPADLIFGRMIYDATFVPMLSAVALWGIVDFMQRRRSASLALSLLAIGCAAQLHVIAAIYGLVWLAVALLGRRHVRWRHIGLVAALLALVLSPYVLFQIGTGWADLVSMRNFLRAPKVSDVQAFDTAGELAGSSAFWRMLPGGRNVGWFHYDALTWALIGLTVLGAGCAIAERRAAQIPTAGQPSEKARFLPSPEYLLLLAWLALPLVFSIRHSQYVAPWYLIGGIPAVAILQGVGIWRLASGLRLLKMPSHPIKLAAATAGLILVAAIGVAFEQFQAAVAADARTTEYGVPLRYSLQAARQLRQLAGNELVYVAAPEDASAVVPYLAGVERYRRFSGRSVTLLPRTSAWYFTQAAMPAADYFLGQFGKPAASVLTTDGSTAYALFHVPGETDFLARPGFVPLQLQIGSAIQLEGYLPHQLAADQPSMVELVWRVVDAHALESLRFSQFAHLVDGSGRIWSQAPDLWNIVEPWSDGDLVVWPVELNLQADTPLGGYWLDTGYYQTFSGQPLPVSKGGASLGNSVRIGPLRVAGPTDAAATAPPLASFGAGELSLLGVRWQGQDVVLDWRADGKPRADYTVFVHAVDAAGNIVAQQDGSPQGGSFPTGLWQPGDAVRDVHHLGLQQDRRFKLEIGLYTQPDLRRLPARVPGQAAPQDHVLVQPRLFISDE